MCKNVHIPYFSLINSACSTILIENYSSINSTSQPTASFLILSRQVTISIHGYAVDCNDKLYIRKGTILKKTKSALSGFHLHSHQKPRKYYIKILMYPKNKSGQFVHFTVTWYYDFILNIFHAHHITSFFSGLVVCITKHNS